jgi:polysaccharide deacetylase family protein (PEP-CTERM system associated)
MHSALRPPALMPLDTPGGARVAAPRINAFTCDVEDWFQVEAFASVIARESWPGLPMRVEANVDRILGLLDAHRVRGTFFVLGWLAERAPGMVERIARAGHEVASHGYGHQRLGTLDAAGFRADVTRAKALLEDLCGRPVLGYRAPSFSVDQHTPWAHAVLLGAGHRYSSSVYPIRHDLYGMPHAPRFPYQAPCGLLEIPPATVRMFGTNLPAAGGGYFRLQPLALSIWALRRMNRVDHASAVFYCHPWEIDPLQPRVDHAPLKSRLRHYMNLDRTFDRLDQLLSAFSWGAMEDVFAERLAH